jgi:hypothetical protein
LRAQQRERTTRNRRTREVQMDRDLAATPYMDAPCRMEKAGQFRQAVALARRRDPGKLVAKAFRE